MVRPCLRVALAFARLGLDWTTRWYCRRTGGHRPGSPAAALAHPKAAMPHRPPEAATGALRAALRSAGRTVYVAERLGTSDERVRDPTADPAAEVTDPHVLISLAGPASPARPALARRRPRCPRLLGSAEAISTTVTR